MRRILMFTFVFGTAALSAVGGFFLGLHYQYSGIISAACNSHPDGSDVESFSMKPVPHEDGTTVIPEGENMPDHPDGEKL